MICQTFENKRIYPAEEISFPWFFDRVGGILFRSSMNHRFVTGFIVISNSCKKRGLNIAGASGSGILLFISPNARNIRWNVNPLP
jgi:hypothetical protein